MGAGWRGNWRYSLYLSCGRPALSVPVSNHSEASWLIDTHILPGGRWPGTKNEGNITPFVVTPPLFMLSARQENSMRVVYTGGPLPADRESLFTLSIAAIPPVNRKRTVYKWRFVRL